ncbi:MAG: L-seryl-tRNA(Sec) selenium transferase [Acidaminobacteraceae bacterium]
MKSSLFRKIPKVDEILLDDRLVEILSEVPRTLVVDCIRVELEKMRNQVKALSDDEIKCFDVSYEPIIESIMGLINKKYEYKLKRVINGTGVVLHTNLGRSLISEEIRNHVMDVACNYSNLEFDIENGKRGSRYSHVEELICMLTGAEAALVVNNNAAAVMLVLSTMTSGKEVIVSRGQLVEIGGSFRIPEVMKWSGAKLVEIGTTNKTHLEDYEDAITDNTSALLKVHTSNYKILGFTSDVDIKDLSELGKKHDIPVIEDIGSGSLIDYSKFGLTKEPTVKESIDSGADVVTFSGDKMLGGPQAGIIVGKQRYIEMMKKNHLTRALRVDKMTFAALEGTLKCYLDEAKAIKQIPTVRMLSMTYHEISLKADALYKELDGKLEDASIEIVDGKSEVGGGSMPLEKMDSRLLSIKHKTKSTNQFVSDLREVQVPLIGRIHEDKLLLDLRTIDEKEYSYVVNALVATCN